MSFVCRHLECPMMSIFQCSCPEPLRFCELHIVQHQRNMKCKVSCIEDDLSASKKKIIEIRKILRTNKKELIIESNKLIKCISDMMVIGLNNIRSVKKSIDKTIKTFNSEEAMNAFRELLPRQENQEKALISIRSTLNVCNYSGKINKAILEELSLDQKQQYFLENDFENFSNFLIKEKFEINSIKFSNDNDYVFICDYYVDSII